MPLTVNTIVRGPDCPRQYRRLPAPLSLRLVTLHTLPPRPPEANCPKPSALGKARVFAWTWVQNDKSHITNITPHEYTITCSGFAQKVSLDDAFYGQNRTFWSRKA